MPKAPKQPTPIKSNVATLTTTATEPPNGWKQNTDFGFMALDKSPEGRLVRLADVLRWIEREQSLPRKEALKVFCDAMPPEIMQWLYEISKADFAKSIPSDYMFDMIRMDEAQKIRNEAFYAYRKEIHSLGGEPEHDYVYENFQKRIDSGEFPAGSYPGKPALIFALNKHWGNGQSIDENVHQYSKIAILLLKAAEIWGYGTKDATSSIIVYEFKGTRITDDFIKLIETRKSNSGTLWTYEQKQMLLDQYESLKKIHKRYGVTKFLAENLGVAESLITEKIREFKTKEKEASNQANRLGSRIHRLGT